MLDFNSTILEPSIETLCAGAVEGLASWVAYSPTDPLVADPAPSYPWGADSQAALEGAANIRTVEGWTSEEWACGAQVADLGACLRHVIPCL